MSTHTNGPWLVAPPELKAGAVIAEVDRLVKIPITIRAAAPSNMARTTEEFDAESEANARLIAAAPDLLTACETALQYHPGDPVRPGPWWRDVVRAAIAKARGEGPQP